MIFHPALRPSLRPNRPSNHSQPTNALGFVHHWTDAAAAMARVGGSNGGQPGVPSEPSGDLSLPRGPSARAAGVSVGPAAAATSLLRRIEHARPQHHHRRTYIQSAAVPQAAPVQVSPLESSRQSQHLNGNRQSVSSVEHSLNQCAIGSTRGLFLHLAFRAANRHPFV